MARVVGISELHLTEEGDRLSSSQFNGVVQAIKSGKYPGRGGYGNSFGEMGYYGPNFQYGPITGYAFEDLPRFSILSIEETSDEYPFLPGYVATTVQAYQTGKIEFTNGGTYVKQGNPVRVYPIGFNIPFLLAYEASTTPVVGQRLGPTNDTFTIKPGGNGYTVLEAPDTDNNLVWVSKVPLTFKSIAWVDTTAIPAATEAGGVRTCGKGNVVLQYVNDSDEIVDVLDENGDPMEIEVLNWSLTDSGTENYVWVAQNVHDGKIYYVNEPC